MFPSKKFLFKIYIKRRKKEMLLLFKQLVHRNVPSFSQLANLNVTSKAVSALKSTLCKAD